MIIEDVQHCCVQRIRRERRRVGWRISSPASLPSLPSPFQTLTQFIQDSHRLHSPVHLPIQPSIPPFPSSQPSVHSSSALPDQPTPKPPWNSPPAHCVLVCSASSYRSIRVDKVSQKRDKCWEFPFGRGGRRRRGGVGGGRGGEARDGWRGIEPICENFQPSDSKSVMEGVGGVGKVGFDAGGGCNGREKKNDQLRDATKREREGEKNGQRKVK